MAKATDHSIDISTEGTLLPLIHIAVKMFNEKTYKQSLDEDWAGQYADEVVNQAFASQPVLELTEGETELMIQAKQSLKETVRDNIMQGFKAGLYMFEDYLNELSQENGESDENISEGESE